MNNYINNNQEDRVFDPGLERCFETIRTALAQNARRIQYLEEENKKLKEEAYRDKELARMKELLEEARKDLSRGFDISEAEEKAIDEWIEKHEAKKRKLKTPYQRMKAQGVSGGRYSYHFYPTALGTAGVIRCYCGAEFEFMQIDEGIGGLFQCVERKQMKRMRKPKRDC